MVDLQIKNALIYDGSGCEAFYGNVTVSNGKIVDVSEETFEAKQTVDAKGLALAPGFIDVHSHSDQSITRAPHRDHVLKMGVTTEVAGQCGISISPDNENIPPHARPNIHRYTPQVFPNLHDAIEEINKLELGTNQHYFTGHGLLRYATVGTEARKSTPDELRQMQEALSSEIKHGSAGFSTGLSYEPGIYSDTHELAMLAKIAGESGGMYTTHSRSESMGLFDSVQECIDIARIGNVKVNISHFKCVGKVFWERCEKALKMIDDANESGLNITLDAYPYIAASTITLSAIPPRFLDKGVEAFAKSLEDENIVNAIKHEIYEVNDPSWDNSMYYVGLENFLIVRAKNTPEFVGKNYVQVGKLLGMSPFDAMIHLLKANNGTIYECRFSMCEENVETIFKHPKCMVGSDGLYLPEDLSVHPRAFGTFPRYLGRYVRNKGILPREEAIRRITSMPAEVYGLPAKGRIKAGYDADLVLFDYDTICDHADFADPFKPNEGIYQVYVNGKLSLENNQPTGIYSGKYLKKHL